VPTPGAAPSSTAYYGPRFDYDPVTLAARGLLVEEARTNLLLNSLISGANLTTQNITVTAVAHTISFYGTGTITLSGTHSATVNGSGAYPTRTTLTFTPTAGTLTCTVSGTVQFAQLEAGAFATSYIPTIASTVTRSADVATITGSLFSQWYNQNEGTIIWTGNFPSFNLNRLVSIDAGVSARTADIFATSPNSISYFKTSDSQQIVINTATANALTNVALAVKANDYNGAVNSALGGSDTSTTGIATADRLSIGNYNSLNQLNGHIRSIRYVPVRAADFQLQALTELPLVPTLDVNFLNNLYEA
jgi:hypothetical protein